MSKYTYRRRTIQGRWKYSSIEAESLYEAQTQAPRVTVYDMTELELRKHLGDAGEICPGSVQSEFIRRRANG